MIAAIIPAEDARNLNKKRQQTPSFEKNSSFAKYRIFFKSMEMQLFTGKTALFSCVTGK